MDNNDQKIIIEKKKKLNALKKYLKNKFIGIDDVIDNIIDYMGPWYVFPDIYSSPLIINLWGTTGVGKTALVKEISRFLSKPLIEVDVGEFGENSDFADTMYGSFMEFSGQEVILLLDEMQNARTLRGGLEQERNYLRGIWKLLSDGTIQINRFFETSKKSLIKKLKRYKVPTTKEQDKKAKSRVHSDYYWEDDEDESSGETKYRYLNIRDKENDVFPPHMMESIVIFTQLSYEEINNIIREDPAEGKTIIKKLIDKSDVSKELNFNKSIVFIAGNLDDLFEFSDDSDPDIDIEALIKNNKRISLPDIKRILSRYFKPEQIARFGNNHLIYPAFSEKDYNKIINSNLDKLFDKYKNKTKIEFTYDESLTKLIFIEGVFPTQGVRPIHSTIKGIVERNCQQFLFDLFCNKNINVTNTVVKISFNESFLVFKSNGKDFKYKIDMKIGSLRKIIVDDKHAVIAAHEAGHAVCFILSAGHVPSKLTAFSVNSEINGFARITIDPDDHLTKEQFFGFIVTAMGGRAAEMELFGEENLLTGSISDLENASRMIVKYVDKNCFDENSPLYCIGEGSNEDFDYPLRQEYKNIKFKEIAENALEQARKNIRDNKKFVLELTNEMLKKESLSKKDVEDIMKKHGIEKVNNYPYLEKIKKHFNELGIEK